MSSSNLHQPPTLPPIGTPSKEWAANTQELLGQANTTTENSNELNVPPHLNRGESTASTVGVPGGWGKDWPKAPVEGGIDTDQIYTTVASTLTTVGQTIQAGVANLTSPNDSTKDHPASGPVGAPAHPSQIASGGITNKVSETVGGFYSSVKGAVGQYTSPQTSSSLDTSTEPDPHVAGLLPVPTTNEGDDLKVKTGGAMINTSPPANHLAYSDEAMSGVPKDWKPSERVPDGVSPVDGIHTGETRANLDKTHAGNYAMTDLPTESGNVTDINAGKVNEKGYITAIQKKGTEYLTSAMAAVGLGGTTTAAAVTSTAPAEEVTPSTKVDHPTGVSSTAAPTSFDPKENILAPSSDISGSAVAPDHDAQRALAKAEGRDIPEFGDEETGTVTPKEKTADSTETSHPIVTTSNTHEIAPVATSPVTAVATTMNETAKPTETPQPAPSSTETPSSSSSPTAHAKESTSNSTNSTPVKGHKRGPSFKDKIKGEMKVLSGKLSSNKAKIEEGKALKTGAASSSS